MWNSVVFVFAVIAVSVAIPPPECMTLPLVNPETCCPSVPQFVSKEIIDECTASGPINCETSNCIMRRGNFLTADDKVDRTALTNYAVPPEWTSTTSAGLQACFSQMNGASCESMKFIGCLAHHLIKNCPASQWVNSADCTAAKNFATKCSPPGL